MTGVEQMANEYRQARDSLESGGDFDRAKATMHRLTREAVRLGCLEELYQLVAKS